MNAEEFRERQDELVGWPIKIVSWRLGDTFFCTTYNVDPGSRLSTGKGATRDNAESEALDKARYYIERSGYAYATKWK